MRLSDTILKENAQHEVEHLHLYFPYRCLAPQKVDGLLVACRAFSSDNVVNTHYNLIPHYITFVEATGTAAVMAINAGIEARHVDANALQNRLLNQGALLPGLDKAQQTAAVG